MNTFTKNKDGKEVDLPLHLAVFEDHYAAAKELLALGAGKLLLIRTNKVSRPYYCHTPTQSNCPSLGSECRIDGVLKVFPRRPKTRKLAHSQGYDYCQIVADLMRYYGEHAAPSGDYP